MFAAWWMVAMLPRAFLETHHGPQGHLVMGTTVLGIGREGVLAGETLSSPSFNLGRAGPKGEVTGLVTWGPEPCLYLIVRRRRDPRPPSGCTPEPVMPGPRAPYLWG